MKLDNYIKLGTVLGLIFAVFSISSTNAAPPNEKSLPKQTIQQQMQQQQLQQNLPPQLMQNPAVPPMPSSQQPPAQPTQNPPPAQQAEKTTQPSKDQQGQQTQGASTDQTANGQNGQDELVYLNVQDADIRDVIKQISKATGRNFIIDDKVKGKVTIISERPMTREEAYQTFLSALEVAGFTIVKGPAGVIKIVGLKDAVTQPIPTHVDATPITDMFITRLIPLQNISAVDMSNAIKGLISKDGNLFAYPATNTLIITDSGTNIDRLMKIIKELDQEGPQQVLEIVPIMNANARDIGQMVNQLFEQEKSKGTTAKTSRVGGKGGELEEMEEVSKIIPDERTNSLIVLASKRAIEKVRNIIARLDRKMEGGGGKIHVYYLKHAKAKQMAETLSTLTSGIQNKAQAQKSSAATSGPIVAEFEGGIKITADETTNSLIITATQKDYEALVDKVISKLDVQRRQVYLESVVMELSVEKGRDIGLQGFGGASKGPISFFGATPYSSVLSDFVKGTPSLPSGLMGGMIGRDTIPITIGNETKNIPSIGLFFSALSTYGDSNIVSTPNILTLDNEEAKIEIKEKEWYKTAVYSTTMTSYNTQSTEAGLTLKITPQIGEADNVTLKIEQVLSGFTGLGSQDLPPPTKERTINTSVVTKDGQTVVLGGLMEDKTSNIKNKIPLLGDIPIIGNLFKQTTMSKKKVNMLVFVTPHILKDASDFTAILKRKIEQRNQFIDDNFGRRQKEQIRSVIKAHREDLLDAPAASSVPVSAPETTPVPTAKQPVITVPSQELSAPVPAKKPVATVLEPTTTVPKQSAVVPTPQAPAPQTAAPAPQTTAPADQGRVKAPVITVQPPAPGARQQGGLNLEY